MPDYLRVKQKETGHELTILADHFNDEAYTKLDKPALDAHGEPAPVKYKTTVATEATAKTASKADQSKES
jgi:hypothetical protein